jgi:Zn-dependent peptidase ImmA (M78 family)
VKEAADFNPQMLTLARESRGLSQTELAELCHIPQPRLSKIENGVYPVEPELLEILGETLAYPFELFSAAEKIYGYGSSCLYHRRRVSLKATDYRRILAQINLIRIHVTRLFRDIELDDSISLPRFDVDDYESPAVIADAVRAALRVAAGPIRNMVALIESFGGVVIPVRFATRKLDAISQWMPGSPPLFVVNQDSPADRLRFTLAHEIGHLVMHMTPTPDQENEANQFAAEFLMPSAEIRPQLVSPLDLPRLAELKSYWRVSMAAIVRRARDLGKITENTYRRLVTRLSMISRGGEPHPLAREVPTLLQKILQIHMTVHGHSAETLANQVLLFVSEFTDRYLPSQRRFQVVRTGS